MSFQGSSPRRLAFRILAILFPFAFFLLPCFAQGVITTVAGGSWVFRGDGGPATNAPLGRILGLAVDSAGNLFAGDSFNNIVVKITPAGVLSVVAGNGILGFSGDGGPATSASLACPGRVALDAAGNLYVADSCNGRIRKVNPAGIISTIAGGGFALPGDGGPATSALLDPQDVELDATGNLYISDYSHHRVRKVSPDGTITTVAGTGTEGFSGDGGPAAQAALFYPFCLAIDAVGAIFITDSGNSRIRKVSPGGIITTVAGSGAGFSPDGIPAISASLRNPGEIAVDAAGNLYIAEAGNHRIRKVTPAGIITTAAGSGSIGFSGDGGPATGASLHSPEGVTVDAAGNVYIGDGFNQRIRKVTPSGTIATVAGNGLFKFGGDGGPAARAFLSSPWSVAVDAAGNAYIADAGNNRIRKVSPNGTITAFAGNGTVGFSGDGGPAANASLFIVESLFGVSGLGGVAVDAAGNLYIADGGNQRVRKVSPAGSITTVAGNGQQGFSGDGGPAITASLSRPIGVAVDRTGNTYIADRGNNRIRKVSPAGTITTLAGNGTFGFSGDDGPAINASLRAPTGVAVDASGSVYIADTGFADAGNHRIRKVSPDGTITTVAGNGLGGFSGDGGPATNASLREPTGVAVDAGGNLYIADRRNNRVRKVSPTGIITTVAGDRFRGFSGDGGAASGAVLSQPAGVAVDAAGNLYIADSGNDRIRKVLAVPPSFSVTPGSLSFSAPGGAPLVRSEPIAVSSSFEGLVWRAEGSTESGGPWLSFSPAVGFTPGVLAVSVDTSALAEGTYRGRITVQVPLASPPTQTVAVELTVGLPLPAQLSVEPSSLTFEIPPSASQPVAQTLRIRNAGSSMLNWTAQASTLSGGNWLSVSQVSGSASGGSPAGIQVTASAAGLAAGVYSGSVLVASPTTNQTQRVAVTLLVSPRTQTILVSQSGLLFTGVEGVGAVPSQSFGILNTGQGVMNWTVEAGTVSGGNWLSVSPAASRSDAASLEVPLVEVAVNMSGLRAGTHSGVVRVHAPGADNSPQFVTAYLNVLPPGSNPGVLVRPTGLIFTAQAGGPSPGSQTVRLATAAAGSVEFVGGVLTAEGGNWLEALPRNGILSASDPRTVTIQPALGFGPGVYRGAITLLFKDGSPTQVVNTLFLVVAGTTAAAGAPLPDGRSSEPRALASGFEAEAAQPCVPQRLHAVHRTLGSSFASPVGWPSIIEVQVADDCGAPVANAAVIASFTNGDPPLELASLRNGIYVGTWRPVNPAAQVTVTARASLPPLAEAVVQAQGQALANPTAPALNAAGIVNGASFGRGEPLAPCSIISVFGRNLAAVAGGALGLPLPKTLAGAALSIGGLEAPLFYSSSGQINAQLPCELVPNSRPHVVVRTRRDGSGPESITVPETVTIATARPGIFTTNQQGTGQGAVLDAQSRLVDTAAPARAGEVVQVFCTGLGATNPRVPSGEPAPAEPLARVVAPVEARIGGRPATVQFAGLAPGFVGLYQVNVEIPAGVEPGPAVALVLFQQGVPSNTVTLAIR